MLNINVGQKLSPLHDGHHVLCVLLHIYKLIMPFNTYLHDDFRIHNMKMCMS